MGTFSAVVTTGIYCRSGCPATPNPANVRTYQLAASAEAAGFRACLRCRPYRSSDIAGSIGHAGPELVCRAVQLIVDGALDGATEDHLGARLGVSGRHLRRLFAVHVGATPDEVARSRRAHFARRLLDDTDLTVTEVAFAAGFGSARQLNRACIDIFRATPTELRSRRLRTDRLAADGGLLLRLPFAGGIEWDTVLAYLARRAIAGVECVDGATYRRTVRIDGDPGVVEVELDGSGGLQLRAHLPHWAGLIHVVQRVRRVFDLDADLEAVVAHLGRDRLLRPGITARPGLRVPGAWDGFETGVRAIVGQQVSVAAATTVMGRIASRYGELVPGLDAIGLTHVFPAASTLAAADLSDVGLTRSRAAAVRNFAGAAASDAVRLDRSQSLQVMVDALCALPGVGPWTAQYLGLRLGYADAFPSSDLGLRRAAAVDAKPLLARDLDALAEGWRPWRAYAAAHLWSVDATTAKPERLAV